METLGIEKVKVFQRDMKVEYQGTLAGDRGHQGECSYLLGELYISSQTNISRQASVLLHEMIHASLDLTKPELDEEENVKILELIFATLIKDNKEVFKIIIEKL